MTQPEKDTEENDLRPGQHDEGGHGGMATRELEAHEREERAQQEADGD